MNKFLYYFVLVTVFVFMVFIGHILTLGSIQEASTWICGVMLAIATDLLLYVCTHNVRD